MSAYRLSWMAEVLRTAGLAVEETPGWLTRGHSDFGAARGVLLHHTAGPRTGNLPSLDVLVRGRSDLSGPLCNLALGRDGKFFAVAAGRAYHAGYGWWPHDDSDKPPQGCVLHGNSELIGIECENTGLPDDPWPGVQLAALRRGVGALLAHVGAPRLMCAGHKEYARNPNEDTLGRKTDPSFDMGAFRASLPEETPK